MPLGAAEKTDIFLLRARTTRMTVLSDEPLPPSRLLSGLKVHMQTLCALAHLDFRQIGAHDHAELFDLIDRLELGPQARAEAYRRMVFNVAAANCDDHTKNVPFLLAEDGEWALSPAYDVTHAHHPASTWTAQHLMAVNGHRVGITGDDLRIVADRFAVPDARRIVTQVLDTVGGWGRDGRRRRRRRHRHRRDRRPHPGLVGAAALITGRAAECRTAASIPRLVHG